jgi:alkaline phosphatase
VRCARFRTRLLSVFLALFVVVSRGWGQEGRAKYVFLLIGDGMATAQRTVAELVGRETGEKPDGLAMNRMPVQGLTYTHSADSLVTDSPAAGTAIACGHKTANGMIGVGVDGEERFTSVAELARDAGMRVGLVTSVSIDQATPAAFYAHRSGRSDYYELAVDMVDSDFDFFGGGAARGDQARYRGDRKTVAELLRAKGYRVLTTRDELVGIAPGEKVWAHNHTCDASAALYYELDRPADHISLVEFARAAVDVLHGEAGFFLMVEGGRIDWACHVNDPASVARETLVFDDVVELALDFHDRYPDETLVVVTGDHECGGMTIGTRDSGYSFSPEHLTGQSVSAQAFAEGVPAWQQVQRPFLQALPDIQSAFGLGELSDQELEALLEAYVQSMGRDESSGTGEYGRRDPLTAACLQIVNRRSGVGWASNTHTGIPAQTSAIGVGSDAFGGCHDNTDIFRGLCAAMGLDAAE